MYVLRRPAAALCSYIEHYWFVLDDGLGTDLRVEVFTDGRADLIFNFGVAYQRTVIGQETVRMLRANVDMQRLVPLRIEQQGAVRVTGVRFRMGGLSPFTGVRLARWSGATPRPEFIFGGPAVELEAALRAEPDPDAAGELLDAFFLRALGDHGPQPAFVRALQLLQTDDSVGSAVLAEEAGVSVRQLQRMFAAQLGFAPKVVARILRFQRALRVLMDDRQVALGDLASAVGYFDQAHFIRDFRQFTGGVPRGYRGYYPPDGPADFAPNVVVFVQDGDRPPVRDWVRHVDER
jgi:AraC-like DNA-binding protein